jgi:hypothetical protein
MLDKLLVLFPTEVSVRRSQSRDAILDGAQKLAFRLARDLGKSQRMNEESS